jgi:hypothetical protein
MACEESGACCAMQQVSTMKAALSTRSRRILLRYMPLRLALALALALALCDASSRARRQNLNTKFTNHPPRPVVRILHNAEG